MVHRKNDPDCWPVRRAIAPSEGRSFLSPSLSWMYLTGTAVPATGMHVGAVQGSDSDDDDDGADARAQLALHPLMEKVELTQLSALEAAITEIILEHQSNGEHCSFDDILEHVSHRWHKLRRKDGIPYHTKIRTAVERVLHGSGSKFQLFHYDAEHGYVLSSDTPRKAGEKEKEKDEDGNDVEDGDEDKDEENEGLEEKSRKIREELGVSELQATVVDAIYTNGGTKLDIDSIIEHVSKFWSSLRKKDGTPYSGDIRKAVLSSLSGSSQASSRFFFRDSEDSNLWHISKHALSFVKQGGLGRAVDVEVDEPDADAPKLDDDEEAAGEGAGDAGEGGDDEEEDLDKITDFQVLIMKCIFDYKDSTRVGYCPMSVIETKISEHWDVLKDSTDCPEVKAHPDDVSAAVLQALEKGQKQGVFAKVNAQNNTWNVERGQRQAQGPRLANISTLIQHKAGRKSSADDAAEAAKEAEAEGEEEEEDEEANGNNEEEPETGKEENERKRRRRA
eukprot:Clim_evm27s230 gene=Clim_evmTU27s230